MQLLTKMWTFSTCRLYSVTNLLIRKNWDANRLRASVKWASNSSKVLDVNTNVAKDVILFKYDNGRFYKILNVFAICQFGFWVYLSHFSFTTLKDVPINKSETAAWYQKINLGENKYRNTMAIVAFLIGYGILIVSWTYTLKSVRYLVLHKGGKELSFVTYTPFGRNRIMKVPVESVSCKETRAASKSQLPIKVKNYYLHYILDMRGEFRNPTLFDHTAGLRRIL